jgi:hypothetical protein
VKAWFYPGDDVGHEFVYPKPRAVALAKANKTPVPSMPAELAANTTKPAAAVNEPHVVAMSQAPLKAQKPTEEEVKIAEIFALSPRLLVEGAHGKHTEAFASYEGGSHV